MQLIGNGSTVRSAVVLWLLASVAACHNRADNPTAPDTSERVVHARSAPTAEVTVSSTNPSHGKRGETGKPVTITGSGFEAGATITWERNGIIDPNIMVESSIVRSSTQIDAVISISQEADLSLYDVGVENLSRKKGIGTEMFEVTTATSIGSFGGGAEVAATNDQSTGVRAVGYAFDSGVQYAFFWPNANGGLAKLGQGQGMGISSNAATITGTNGGYAVVWNASGSSWINTRLPITVGSTGSRGNAMASDSDGAALIIGGSEIPKTTKGNASLQAPRIWRRNGPSWQLFVLPLPGGVTGGAVWSVNAMGQAVGGTGLYWDSNGLLTQLPGPSAGARGISPDGTIATGYSPAPKGGSEKAIYWLRSRDLSGVFGPWTGPFNLPGGCLRAVGVDNQNRILAQRCLSSTSRYVSAVFLPPYDVAGMITLNGTGQANDAGTAAAISPNGSLIGGKAASGDALVWSGVLP